MSDRKGSLANDYDGTRWQLLAQQRYAGCLRSLAHRPYDRSHLVTELSHEETVGMKLPSHKQASAPMSHLAT